MNKKIKAIIFDLGGVLLLTKAESHVESHLHRHLGVHGFIAKNLKISLDQYFDSIDTTYAKSIEGKLSEKKVLEILSKNLNVSKKKILKIYSKAYNRIFKKNSILFQKAKELKKLGYKTAILSDQWHLSKKVLISSNLLSDFDVKIISCDVKMRKPNPKIYSLVLRKLKLKPSEVIFIDNQKWNIKPAKQINMKTILFKNNNQLFKNKIWKNLFKK
jgi:epoxide hydrolase-like predicted phosphatase